MPLILQSFVILRLILWPRLSCPCFHTVANYPWLALTRGRNATLKQAIYMASVEGVTFYRKKKKSASLLPLRTTKLRDLN